MKRVIIDKNDTVAAVVERVIANAESDIVLVIPRDAAFKSSSENFDLLKREAAAASKVLRVESVDDEVLALAEASGLGATHPLLAGSARSLSDIIPAGKVVPASGPARRGAKAGSRTAPTVTRSVAKKVSDTATRTLTIQTEKSEEEEIMPAPRAAPIMKESAYAQKEAGEEDAPMEDAEESDFAIPRRSYGGRKVLLGIALTVVVLLLGAWAFGAMFGRADIAIAFKKTAWSFDAAVSGTKAATAADPEAKILPIEVFRTTKTTTRLFPASGRATVSDKARGKIIVYNAYSSAPQPLVATTRFVTPDGKVFRLEKQITVPGAAIKDSKIVPASIEADVIADKPGAEYNLGAVERLNVPGFKDSPGKYEGFYGSLKSSSGGFVGERSVPTEKDIAAAKGTASEILLAGLREQSAPARPEGFVVPDGASAATVTKLTVNSRTDDQGNFSVFGEAELREVGFREGDLRDMLSLIAAEGDPHLALTGLALQYRDAKPDFVKGTLGLTVAASGTLTTAFGEETFRGGVAGKSLAEARIAVAGLYGLTKAEVVLKPFWLRALPGNPDRIKVRLE